MFNLEIVIINQHVNVYVTVMYKLNILYICNKTIRYIVMLLSKGM